MIQAENLFVYREKKQIIRAINAEFRPGDLVGLIGPNGAGKSTLLKTLAGYILADCGDVYWNHKRLRDLSPQERGAIGGYLPQNTSPSWEYSVRELLSLGASRALTDADAISHTIKTHDLEGILNRRWATLSGGEKARSMLAAVMVTSPQVLLVDEPGASLDIRHRLNLLETLRKASQSSVVIVVLHDIELAVRFCTRLVVMHDGQIVSDGSASDIANQRVLDDVFNVKFQRVRIKAPFDTVLGTPDDHADEQGEN